MADAPVYEGKLHLYFLPAVADYTTEVTTGELAAGTDITEHVTKDGWNPSYTNNRVAMGNLATTFDAERMGSYGAQPSLRLLRNDTSWALFPRGTTGYLVESYDGPAIAGSEVTVFPIETGSREPQASAANERQTFMVPIAVTDDPAEDVEVVTGS